MNKLVIMRIEDGMFLAGFTMVEDLTVPCGTMPNAIWSDEVTLSWDESDFALVCMLSVGINTVMKDINYCEVMDGDVINPENN